MKEKRLGEITLVHGDCMEYMRSLPCGSVDLVVTDPPYLIPAINGGGSVNIRGKLNATLKTFKDNIRFSYDIKMFADELERIQEDNINAYFFCNKLQIPEYIDVYVLRKKCKFDLLCWHKTNVPPTYANKYLSDTEYILYFHKGKGRTCPNDYEAAATYWVLPMNVKDKQLWEHPTIKPMNIVQRLIANSSQEGDTVFDPFMGSGTTGVACHNLKRKFIGCEIEEEYFEIAERRINTARQQLALDL